ncbi:MAG: hypothetical protein Q8O38_13095 [Sulfurimicrobium sp.]|nr:hypothetical protein [Sulfurimicrobium sp.]
MTPQAALIELLARVGASDGDAIAINEFELNEWPSTAVAAMKTQRLLVKTRAAKSAVCPECEEACVMPLQVLLRDAGMVETFIVCDKRSDVDRVPISTDRSAQWQCNVEAVCDWIAATLGLRRSEARRLASADFLEIGMMSGIKRIQMLCLKFVGELRLVSGGNELPLADCVTYDQSAYAVDSAMIGLLVDAATTADNRYTPSNAKREARKVDTQAMYKGWQKAYRELVKKRPNMPETWYANQIAKLPVAKGRSAGTIKKNMQS